MFCCFVKKSCLSSIAFFFLPCNLGHTEGIFGVLWWVSHSSWGLEYLQHFIPGLSVLWDILRIPSMRSFCWCYVSFLKSQPLSLLMWINSLHQVPPHASSGFPSGGSACIPMLSYLNSNYILYIRWALYTFHALYTFDWAFTLSAITFHFFAAFSSLFASLFFQSFIFCKILCVFILRSSGGNINTWLPMTTHHVSDQSQIALKGVTWLASDHDAGLPCKDFREVCTQSQS